MASKKGIQMPTQSHGSPDLSRSHGTPAGRQPAMVLGLGGASGRSSPEAREAPVTQNWAQLFSSAEEARLEFIEPVKVNGKILVKPPREVLEEGLQQWRNSVIAQVIGRMPSFAQFQKALSLLWGKNGDVSVKPAGNNLFLIQFQTEETCQWVLENGPWHIHQCPLILRKWRPGMKSLNIQLDRLPTWMNFYNIPLEYYTKRGLAYISSAVGVPLHMDSCTAKKEKVAFARICVEINARQETPKSVEVELADGSIAKVDVEIPWMPPVCKKCSSFGHIERFCPHKSEWRVKDREEPKQQLVPSQVPEGTSKKESTGKGKLEQEVADKSMPLGNQFEVLGNLPPNDTEGASSSSGDGKAFESLTEEDAEETEQCEQCESDHVNTEDEETGEKEALKITDSPRKKRAASAGVEKLMKQMKSDTSQQLNQQKIDPGKKRNRKKKDVADGSATGGKPPNPSK